MLPSKKMLPNFNVFFYGLSIWHQCKSFFGRFFLFTTSGSTAGLTTVVLRVPDRPLDRLRSLLPERLFRPSLLGFLLAPPGGDLLSRDPPGIGASLIVRRDLNKQF